MDKTLRICVEAEYDGEEDRGKHIYFIYSVKMAERQTMTPTLTEEICIKGFPSMGCGLYGSKIVLAGGQLGQCKQRGIITFDMTDGKVSSNTFPPMKRGKLKPLVFELNKKLYVMDRGNYVNRRSFEFFYTPKPQWHRIYNPAYEWVWPIDIISPEKCFDFSCLVIGNSVCLSTPERGYIHHSNYTYKSWDYWICKLPFPGVATFHCQEGFGDLLVISFNNGDVEARTFDGLRTFGNPQMLFRVDTTCQPNADSDANMTGYFADFGGGNFCLTVCENECLHVYMFNIFREASRSNDDSMVLNCKILNNYKYDFDGFTKEGYTILGLVGCFAPGPNYVANSHADELMVASRYRGFVEADDENPYADYDSSTNNYLFSGYNSSSEEEEDEDWDDTRRSWLNEVHYKIKGCHPQSMICSHLGCKFDK